MQAPGLQSISLVYTRTVIDLRVKELAAQAAALDNLLIVAVMDGAAMFAADFMRAPHYWKTGTTFATVSARWSRIPGDPLAGVGVWVQENWPPGTNPVEGRNVLILDVLCDTGETLHNVTGLVKGLNPLSIATAVLLDTGRAPARPAYVGFEAPLEPLVGYGMDAGGEYRGLPYIAKLGG